MVKASPSAPGAFEPDGSTAFRALPSVAAVMAEARLRDASLLNDEALTRAIQEQIDEEREAIAAGAGSTRDEIARRILSRISALDRPRLRPVINATGIIIHTNLGRAPVSRDTAEAMAAAAGSYVALEIEPDSNQRGGRMREIATLLRLQTGAEDTIVVNNNAAAVLLVLSSVAAGGSVVVSRGEAVEIGGGFRVPDVMHQSGAVVVEVGTTNRTYASDYADAIGDTTAALLKVHPSNFRMSGFVHSATVAELVHVAAPHGIPVVEDLGSGALLDVARFGLMSEPTIGESLRQGAALVTASGDKLLGGPQAGIIAGAKDWIVRVARHPLARAVRADKTCLAGVAATLRHYARGEAVEKIPVWRMIAADATEIAQRAHALAEELARSGIVVEVATTEAAVGGGSLPGQTLPSWALALGGAAPEEMANRLRMGEPRVFGHIDSGRVLLDLRTVLPEQDAALAQAIVLAHG